MPLSDSLAAVAPVVLANLLTAVADLATSAAERTAQRPQKVADAAPFMATQVSFLPVVDAVVVVAMLAVAHTLAVAIP